MSDRPEDTGAARPERVEQQLYARLLDVGAKTGFAALVAGFVAYVAGWVPAHVPVEQLAGLWRLPLAEYLKATGTPTGWGWIVHLPKGEFTSLAGIALLSGCSLVALLAVIPVYLKRGDRGDRIYAALCVGEIALLLLAASGVLTAAH
jgi:hypothetical protein